MDNELVYLGERLVENKFLIAKKVHDSRVSEFTEQQKAQLSSPVEEELINIRANFVGLFGEILKDQLEESVAIEKVINWGNVTGELIFTMGVPLEEALKDTRFYLSYICRALREDINKNNMSVDTVFAVGSLFDSLLDHAAYAFSLTFVNSYCRDIQNAKEVRFELSIPVVSQNKETAILPLIGKVDTERSKLLIEETLNLANRPQLERLILDLSGVYMIDTMVADQIFKVVDSLKLLGVETILTGIRPEFAQTMISLGLNFNHIKKMANIEQAIDLYLSLNQWVK